MVTIVRSRLAVTYPSRFQLVLATNPCPCGHFGEQSSVCECLPGRIASYKDRLSGPILDRIDMKLQVPRVTKAEIAAVGPGDPSSVMRERVVDARERQRARLAPFGVLTNAEIPPRFLLDATRLTSDAIAVAEEHVESGVLSMRGLHRTLRVARTLADMEGADETDVLHVVEAISLRIPRQPAAT